MFSNEDVKAGSRLGPGVRITAAMHSIVPIGIGMENLFALNKIERSVASIKLDGGWLISQP